MNVPVFIDISLEDQAEELRVYFKSLGAEISAERSEKGIEDDLHKIIGVCDVALGKDKDGEQLAKAEQLEKVLNGVVSMLGWSRARRARTSSWRSARRSARRPRTRSG